MSFRRRVLGGTALLTAGQLGTQILGFARNVVIARMLSPADVGIAATIAILLSLVETISDLSIDKLLIQAGDGEDAKLQACCHTVLIGRGLVQSLTVLLLAWPAAHIFNLPDLLWAFQLVALGPVIKGLAHSDIARAQRGLRFGPTIVVDLVPQVFALVLVIPLALWLGDFRVILFSTLAQAGIYVLCSHFVAQRPYRLGWHRPTFRRIAHFGWPLVINGVLFFAIAQGDRIAIAKWYSKEELAWWTNALLVASAPMVILGKIAMTVAMPLLSACRADRDAFERHYRLCIEGLAWAGISFASLLLLAGGPIMSAVFGEPYLAAGAYVGLLAIAQALRAVRIAPTVAALAHGDTKLPALGNAVRFVGVLVAFVFAASGSPLEYIAIAAVGSEIASFAAGVARLDSKKFLGWIHSARPLLPLTVCFVALSASVYWAELDQHISIQVAVLVSLIISGLSWLCFQSVRRASWQIVALRLSLPLGIH